MSSTPSHNASRDPSPTSDSSAKSPLHTMHSLDVNEAHFIATSTQSENPETKLLDTLPDTVGSSLPALGSLPDNALPSSLSAYSNLSNDQLHQFLLTELDSLAAAAMPYRYGSMVNNPQIPLVPACLCCPAPLASSPSTQPLASSMHHPPSQTHQGNIPSQPTVLHTLFQSQEIQKHAAAYKKNYGTPSLTDTATILTNASSSVASSTSSAMDTLSILPHPLLSLSLHEDPLLNGDLPSSSLRARILLLLEREREVVRRERLVCLAERALMDDAVAMRKRALAVAVCARETQRQMANLAVLGAGEEVVMSNSVNNRQMDGQMGVEGYVEAREERVDEQDNEQIGKNTEFRKDMVGEESATAAPLDNIANVETFTHSRKNLHIDTTVITSTDDDEDGEDEDEEEEEEDEDSDDDDVSETLHAPPLPLPPTLDFAVLPETPATTTAATSTTTTASIVASETTNSNTSHLSLHHSSSRSPSSSSSSSSHSPSSGTTTSSLPLLALIEAAAADDVIEADTWLRNLCSDATQLHTSLKTIEKTYAHARVLELVGALRWAICELYRRDKHAFIGADMNVVVPNLDLLLSTTPIMEVSLTPLVDILTHAGTAPIPTSVQIPVPAIYSVNQAAETPLPYFPPPPLPLPLPLSGLSVSCAFTSYSAYLHAIYEHCTTTTATVTTAMTTANAPAAVDASGVVVDAMERENGERKDKDGETTSTSTSSSSSTSTSTSTATSTSPSSPPPRPTSPASIKAMLSTLGSLLAAHCREEQQRAKDWVRLVGEEVEREDVCVSGDFGDGVYADGTIAVTSAATATTTTIDAVGVAVPNVDINTSVDTTTMSDTTTGPGADGGSGHGSGSGSGSGSGDNGVGLANGRDDMDNVGGAAADTTHTHTAHVTPTTTTTTTTTTHTATSSSSLSSPSSPSSSSSSSPLPPQLPNLLTMLSQHLVPLLKLLTHVGREDQSHSIPTYGSGKKGEKKGDVKTVVEGNMEKKDEMMSEPLVDVVNKRGTVLGEPRSRVGESEACIGNSHDADSEGDDRNGAASGIGRDSGRGRGGDVRRERGRGRDEDSEKSRGDDTSRTARTPRHSPSLLPPQPHPPLTPRLHTPRTPRHTPSKLSLPPLHGDLPPLHSDLTALHNDRTSLHGDSSVLHSDRSSLHSEAPLSARKSSHMRPSPSPSQSPSPMRKRGTGTGMGTGPSTTVTPGKTPSRLPLPRRRVMMSGNDDGSTQTRTASPIMSPKGVSSSVGMGVGAKDGVHGTGNVGMGVDDKDGKDCDGNDEKTSNQENNSEFMNKSIISHIPGLNIGKSSDQIPKYDIPKSNSHNSLLLASSSSSSSSSLYSRESLNALKKQCQEFTSSLGNLLPSAPFPDAISEALLHLASQVEQHIAVCQYNSNVCQQNTGNNTHMRQNSKNNGQTASSDHACTPTHVRSADHASSATNTKMDVHTNVDVNAPTQTPSRAHTGASSCGGNGSGSGSGSGGGSASGGHVAGAGAGSLCEVSLHHGASGDTHTTTPIATTRSPSSHTSPTNTHTSTSTTTSASPPPHTRTPTLRADPTTIARFAWSAPAPLLALLLKKGVPLGFTPTIASTSTSTSTSTSASSASSSGIGVGVGMDLTTGAVAASNDIARFSSQQAISQSLQPPDSLLLASTATNTNTSIHTNAIVTATSSPSSASTTTVGTGGGAGGVEVASAAVTGTGAGTGTGVNVTDSPSLRAHRPTLPSIFESPSPSPLHTMVRHTALPKIQDIGQENTIMTTSTPASSISTSGTTQSGSIMAANMGTGAGTGVPTLPLLAPNVALPLPGVAPGISGNASGVGQGVLSVSNIPYVPSGSSVGNGDGGMGGARASIPVLGTARTPRGISADNTPRIHITPSHTPSYGPSHPSSHHTPHHLPHPPRTLSPSKRMSLLASPSEFDLNKPLLHGNGSVPTDMQLQHRPSLNMGTGSVDNGTGYANTNMGNSNSKHDIDLLHRTPTASRDTSENGGRGPGKIRIPDNTPNSRRGGGKNGTESMSARGRGSFFGGNNGNLGNGTESISGRPRGSIFSGNGLESSRARGSIFSGNGLESARGDGTGKRASVMDRVPTNVNDTKDAFQFTSGGHWQLNADHKGG